MKSRIMYIANKSVEGLNGRGRIGRVTYSKTGKTIYYAGRSLQSLKGGYKCNYYDLENRDRYWISGPKKDGSNRLYQQPGIPIDEDVREEYWREIRKLPARVKDILA